jgi:DNA helicase-2/ATP-dependent DNA helicase PcrA
MSGCSINKYLYQDSHVKVHTLQYLEDLNNEQKMAVETTEGPVLVLAGAGSGKTRVLTYRIAHILHEKKALPWEILAMTFTNKAAGEMRERIQKLVGIEKGIWVGTFHSIFSKIVRWEADFVGYTSDYVIYDMDDQERVIKSIMETERISTKEYFPKSIGSVISRLKNQLIGPDTFSRTTQNRFEETVARIYPSYCLRLRSSNALDFDDLITIPIQLFSEHPEILEKYQTRFRYILVDEYQDTNKAQYVLLKLLSQMHRNLCVVGDDDQ